MNDAQVIVVGAGHNGLICAAYLARAGIDTILLESRSSVGGCASTESDLGARFNICNCDHSLVRAMPLIDELDLGSHGLNYVESEISAINTFHPADGETSPPWLFFADTERTLESIAAAYPAQVDNYRRYLDDAMPVAKLVVEMARTLPTGPRFMSGVAGKKGAGARRVLEWSRMSVADILGSYFGDAWQLIMPAVSQGPTVWGLPPETPGTGMAALGYATRHLVKTGRPIGGSGALTDAVAASFTAAGGTVRCNARVEHLITNDGRVSGVRLDDGAQLRADTVVAACDPQRVFNDWVDEAPASAQKLVERWRSMPVHDGYESKVDAVLDAAPTPLLASQLPDQFAGLDLISPTTFVSPSPAQLADAHAKRAEGLVSQHPTMLINVPSNQDELMAPEGGHVLSIEVLFTPYELQGGWPGSSEPERWLDLWASHMEPGARQSVQRFRAMTPDVYERDFSMHRGHTPAFAGSPLAALMGKTPELTRYRTALEGLYLSGAATYPGAGVFGAPGRNAADAVRRDLTGSVDRRLAPVRRKLAGLGVSV